MRTITACALFLTVAVVPPAAAQACYGLPTAPGEFALQASLETGSGLQSYGVGAVGNLNPAFAGASYHIDDRGERAETGQTIATVIGFELPVPASSVCLISEPSFSSFETLATGGLPAADFRAVRIPILVGVGQRLDVGETGVYVIPAARAGAVYRRAEIEIEGAESADAESTTDVLIAAGATVGRGVAFGRVGFTATTAPGAKPRLVLQFGMHLP